MTTSELVESLIDAAMTSYKRNSRGASEARRLDRHEPVLIDGVEFRYWREYAVYKVAQHIAEMLPEAEVSTELDGNDSCITVAVSEQEQRKLNSSLFILLKKADAL